MAVEKNEVILLDYTITKIEVDEQGIGSRKRVADQHVQISKSTMDKLILYFINENVLLNKVNTDTPGDTSV